MCSNLQKFGDRFVWDSGDIFTWEMHYDLTGRYIGQVQENILDDGPCFFFRASTNHLGLPYVNDPGSIVPSLTFEQMREAYAYGAKP
jgi:hypothetical protein